mmetsp:Transcript_92247/g.214281  ORF Transcript_92247/g.214281 Transcript_92247/m.214281 type:complete len:271 (+) Transcript_92247:138-950(+)
MCSVVARKKLLQRGDFVPVGVLDPALELVAEVPPGSLRFWVSPLERLDPFHELVLLKVVARACETTACRPLGRRWLCHHGAAQGPLLATEPSSIGARWRAAEIARGELAHVVDETHEEGLIIPRRVVEAIAVKPAICLPCSLPMLRLPLAGLHHAGHGVSATGTTTHGPLARVGCIAAAAATGPSVVGAVAVAVAFHGRGAPLLRLGAAAGSGVAGAEVAGAVLSEEGFEHANVMPVRVLDASEIRVAIVPPLLFCLRVGSLDLLDLVHQ